MNKKEYRKHLEKCSDEYYERIKKICGEIEDLEIKIEELEEEQKEKEAAIEEINKILDDLDLDYGDYNYIPYDFKLLD